MTTPPQPHRPVTGLFEAPSHNFGQPVNHNPTQLPPGQHIPGGPIPAPSSSATGTTTPPLSQTMGGGILADYSNYQASAPAQYTPAAYADGTPGNASTAPGSLAGHLPQLAVLVGVALALSLGLHFWRKHHHKAAAAAD